MSLHLHVDTLTTGTSTLVTGLDIHVAPGAIHTVMGPSGSGKSSLLAAVVGSLPPGLQFRGSVTLSGQVIDHLPTERRQVGILFQDDLLFAHMTVADYLYGTVFGYQVSCLADSHWLHSDHQKERAKVHSSGRRCGCEMRATKH